ncbi:hypothetical protein FKM82_025301 [Ascaphus truei]
MYKRIKNQTLVGSNLTPSHSEKTAVLSSREGVKSRETHFFPRGSRRLGRGTDCYFEVVFSDVSGSRDEAASSAEPNFAAVTREPIKTRRSTFLRTSRTFAPAHLLRSRSTEAKGRLITM